MINGSLTKQFMFVLQLERKGSLNEITVIDILSLVGDVGGFHDALVIIVQLLVSFYVSKMSDYSLVRSIFKVRL